MFGKAERSSKIACRTAHRLLRCNMALSVLSAPRSLHVIRQGRPLGEQMLTPDDPSERNAQTLSKSANHGSLPSRLGNEPDRSQGFVPPLFEIPANVCKIAVSAGFCRRLLVVHKSLKRHRFRENDQTLIKTCSATLFNEPFYIHLTFPGRLYRRGVSRRRPDSKSRSPSGRFCHGVSTIRLAFSM